MSQNQLNRLLLLHIVPPTIKRTLTIAVDDRVYALFIDGKRISGLEYANEWQYSDSVALPGNAQLIAVRGVNIYGDAGVLASTDDGYILTNTSWKCAIDKERGWQNIDFDDSSWPNAFEIMPYSKKQIIGIRDDALWIWTKDYQYEKGDRAVICRLKLP